MSRVTSSMTPVAEAVARAIQAYAQTCPNDDPLYGATARNYMLGCVSLNGPNLDDAPLKVNVTQMERYHAADSIGSS